MMKPVPRWYLLISTFAGLAVAVALNMVFVVKVDHQSDSDNEQNDRKWCTRLITLDDAYTAGPTPTTEVGRRVAKAIHDLRTDLNC